MLFYDENCIFGKNIVLNTYKFSYLGFYKKEKLKKCILMPININKNIKYDELFGEFFSDKNFELKQKNGYIILKSKEN